MNIQEGDRVLVNTAPFIGSTVRASQSIACEVLAISGLQVHVPRSRPAVAFRCGCCRTGSRAMRTKPTRT